MQKSNIKIPKFGKSNFNAADIMYLFQTIFILADSIWGYHLIILCSFQRNRWACRIGPAKLKGACRIGRVPGSSSWGPFRLRVPLTCGGRPNQEFRFGFGVHLLTKMKKLRKGFQGTSAEGAFPLWFSAQLSTLPELCGVGPIVLDKAYELGPVVHVSDRLVGGQHPF